MARNGPEFEGKIRQNEINNPKFNFLNASDPYHAYYQHKVKEIEEGKDLPMPPSSIPLNQTTNNQQQNQLQSNLQKLTISAKTQDTQSRIIEQIIIPKEPPPDFEFIADAPSLMPLDIDVIKLTAQFVARNGNPFRNSIMNKEQRNPMFDFLKPQHSHFTYFTRLVEQYTKILLPPRDIVEKLKKEIENPYNILKDVAYRVEWEKIQQREKAKMDEMAEKERVAYAQVDWHDFVVVETVDYQPNEIGNFPPSTTPEDVGARVIALERIESDNVDGGMIDYNSRLLMSRIINDEARVEISSLSKQLEASDKNIDEVAMDEDSDEEEAKKRSQKAQEPKMPIKKDLPLPPNPDHVIIRKDYDPKAKNAPTSSKNAQETYYKSPLTGELISSSMMSEHMRIAMLDPRWIEQRQKEKKEREEQEEVLATGFSIEKNLKRLAEYRSDVFGSGADEVIIGRKLGDEEKKKDDVTWDGHKNTVEKTATRAMTGISVEDQIKSIHNSQGMDMSVNMLQQQQVIMKPPAQSMQAQQQQQMILSNYKILNMPPMSQPPPQQLQQQLRPMQMMPPQQMDLIDEQPAKRLKTEDTLMPESEFLAQNSFRGPISFSVQIPNVPEKPEWNLNGQLIPFTMPLTETIATIKNKLMEYLNMPIAKQKLQLEVYYFFLIF